MQNRLEQLLTFLEKEPNDPFLLYAIATEYLKNDAQKALQYYENLLENHPNYIATYYHAAQLYAKLEKLQQANDTYKKGLEKCQIALGKGTKNAIKYFKELESSYEVFLMEFEDEL